MKEGRPSSISLARHTMAKRFLADNASDYVGLARMLGHESLSTVPRYTRISEGQLAESAERMGW
jgi:site-specific recombinase XerD